MLDRIKKLEHKRIALFGFAPMPSLVKLGTVLNNKYDVEVYQLHRNGKWGWDTKRAGEAIDFKVNRLSGTTNIPLLVFSLSFPILERIRKNHPSDNIWEITIDNPNVEFLSSPKILYNFGRVVEKVLDEISKECHNESIHVFMAMPVACAIEFGRVWQPKANPSLHLYDYDRYYSKTDKLAITLK